ncbi:unnamed protein product [Hymenolepis diminuta]|uniref:Protein kinase domain-containing protein n=1 Tax=Hymenolepis diminuta TaxID=6216 RepID=A0A158QBQ9_HYMDI|nr:unnamed protein product [Hymenolepis diminuta]
MQEVASSVRSRSLPPLSISQSAQRSSLFQTPSRLTLALCAAQEEEPCENQVDNCEDCKRMGSVDELFSKNLKILRRFQDMTECQKLKIQQAKSYLQTSRELNELKMTVSMNSPQPMSSQQSPSEINKWDFVDKATRLYNALSADQQKFCTWISWIDDKFDSMKPSADEDLSLTAEVLCDFESDQGVLCKQEIVKVIEIEDGNALVSGRAVTTERQVGLRFGLYNTLKSSIERQHRIGSLTSSQTCDSCRARGLKRSSLGPDFDGPKITQQISIWIPLIYLQPLNVRVKLFEKAGETRNYILSVWEAYMKEIAQAVMNLLFMAFKHWTNEKVDVDYDTINCDMKQSLKNFFRSLEGSLSNDWECEIHYELILQQLRLLQSGDISGSEGQRFGMEEAPGEKKTEKIGKLMLERRIIFSLLEKHQEVLQMFEAAKQGPVKSFQALTNQSEANFIPTINPFEHFPGFKEENKEVDSSYAPARRSKLGSVDSFASLNEAPPELHVKGTLSETSLLSPPPPFDKQTVGLSTQRSKTGSLSQKLELATSQAKAERLEKRLYGSEPCILEATAAGRQRQSQTPINFRYRSADLSQKRVDKCSRIHARSSEKGGHRSFPKLTHPMPVVKKSSPVKLAVVHPGGVAAGEEVGYVVIMRPSFRERITTVLDTKRRKRVSIHAAIERGIAGFDAPADEPTNKAETEEQLSEEDQKRGFFVFDTATGEKFNFDQALKKGIIHYDSSATESIVFDEYAKSEWRGVKSVYHPLVYRIEQVREVVERDGKLIRQKHNWMPFHQAVERGRLDRRSAEYIVRAPVEKSTEDGGALGEEILRLSFAKALAYGLVKVVPLRHCLIEKLPREKCIFA